jgi:hypothetical protein
MTVTVSLDVSPAFDIETAPELLEFGGMVHRTSHGYAVQLSGYVNGPF